MATMLADHIGWNFIDNPMILTWIGRIAFPCYAFLLAEGFFFVFKDKRRLLKHISTFILLAVISEPCYDLLEFWPKVLSSFMQSQSVIITLVLWFLGMSITELLIPSKRENNEKTWWKTMLIIACAYLLIAFTNYKMEANFNLVWPLLIIVGGHALAALILSFSNGKLWYHKKRFKIFYTLFYPVHALIIWIIICI